MKELVPFVISKEKTQPDFHKMLVEKGGMRKLCLENPLDMNQVEKKNLAQLKVMYYKQIAIDAFIKQLPVNKP